MAFVFRGGTCMSNLEIKRKKVDQIFRYMKALNEIKNPVAREVKDYDWSLYIDEKLPQIENCCSILMGDKIEEILKVTRPTRYKCPKPDESLLVWLKDGWDKLDNEPICIEKKLVFEDDKENEAIYIKFDELEGLNTNYKDWKLKRDQWKTLEKEKIKCIALYDRLFSLHSALQRDSESMELILGDGMLNWNIASKIDIHHPILLQKIELNFNPNIPEFTISLQDGNTVAYIALLRTIELVDKKALAILSDDLKENNYQIIDIEESNSYLKRFITSIVSGGEFIENNRKSNGSSPIISRQPIIFLRKRTLGYSVMIEAILEDIKTMKECPIFLEQIIGEVDDGKNSKKNLLANSIDINGIDRDILLSKPANREQLYIAKILENYGSVLVQGPPGTGKTHTIANIIGHLLSEGKSVLVTSHTDKALSVLKEKIQESIRPLCLSVTGNSENRKEMSTTLNAMNVRRSNIDELNIKEEIKSFEFKRNHCLEDLGKLKKDLILARNNEYENLVIAGEVYKPIDAAKMVRDNKLLLKNIPAPVKIGELLPFSYEDFVFLYHSNKLVNGKEETELRRELPSLEKLISPEEVKSLLEDLNQSYKLIKGWNETFWNFDKIDTEVLSECCIQLKQFEEELFKMDEFELEMIDAGIENGARKESWKELFDKIKDIKHDKELFDKVNLDSEPIMKSEFINENGLLIINELIKCTSDGKKLGSLKLIFKKSWKNIIENSKINGENPKSVEDFQALKSMIEFQLKKHKVFRRWSRQIPEYSDLKDIKDVKIAYQNVERIELLFDWKEKKWEPMIRNLKSIGFSWELYLQGIEKPISQKAEVDYIKSQVSSGINDELFCKLSKLKYEESKNKLKSYIQFLRLFCVDGDSSIGEMIKALDNEDFDLYKKMYQNFIKLVNKKDIIQKRFSLLDKLKTVAPKWADQIEYRVGFHGDDILPTELEKSWIIRQLHDELQRRNKLDVEMVQQKIMVNEKNLKYFTEELVDRKAWYKKVSSMTNTQIQAIESWHALIKKVGKGTGKRAPKLLAEARKLMPICQTAVPVWIMPLSKVVENFDPAVNRFDVVIIDEASQADIMAMNAIYLAKQVIVVGDDEQVSPSAVGQKLDEVQALIDTYFDGNPRANLFDGQFSIYDMAKTSGFKPVTLMEHFRCLPQIIGFSNYLSYDGNIKPLRDDNNIMMKPAVVSHYINNGHSEKDINVAEANEIAALIIAFSKFEEYNDKTVGVISLLGNKQAPYVESILQQRMDPIDYTKRHIQCGNPATFQGDERDIIFLTMVSSPNENGGPLSLRSAESVKATKQRYNVAASRAKNQMWVIYSLDSDKDLKEGDIRKRLIKYALNPTAYDIQLEENLKKSESPFESEVMRMIMSKGYKVKPQWKVGAYRIDMVVEGSNKKLAVECDGEKWHTSENLISDMQRQAILERLGWTFIRIRGSEFYQDAEFTMEKVFNRLDSMGILPELDDLKYNDKSLETFELKNEVVREARLILKEWEKDVYEN